MNIRRTLPRLSRDHLNRFLDKWGLGIVITSIILVLVSTLSPFNFSWENGFSVRAIASSFHNRVNSFDFYRYSSKYSGWFLRFSMVFITKGKNPYLRHRHG
jgi:hypothetical protein